MKLERKNTEIALSGGMLNILNRFSEVKILPSKSYLAGGTAASLYLGHRLSKDLDLFSFEKFDVDLVLDNLRRNFYGLELEISEDNTLICQIMDKKERQTRFSLFFYPYPLLDEFASTEKILLTEGSSINVIGFKDLISMKSVAIVQRGTAKDFVDLYFLMKEGEIKNINEIFALLKKKYQVEENYLYNLQSSFVYFDDAEPQVKEVVMYDNAHSSYSCLSNTMWGEIKCFFKNLILEGQNGK